MNSLVTYRPLRSGLNPVWGNLFDDFFDFSLNDEFKKPLTDIVEKEGSFDFAIELPGFSEDEIDVRLEKDVLTIKAEKAAREEKEEGSRNIISERLKSITDLLFFRKMQMEKKYLQNLKTGFFH